MKTRTVINKIIKKKKDIPIKGASLVAQMVKNLAAMQESQVQSSWDPGRSPGGGHGNPLQYSCLGNPMDRGAWWPTVHRVAKSWTLLKRLSRAQYNIASKPECYTIMLYFLSRINQ